MSQQKNELDKHDLLMARACSAVWQERERQNKKWGHQRHTDGDWLKILVEEVGELAQAMQFGGVSAKSTDATNKLVEVIQVAAVAQAIAEQWIEEMQNAEFCEHDFRGVSYGDGPLKECRRCGHQEPFAESQTKGPAVCTAQGQGLFHNCDCNDCKREPMPCQHDWQTFGPNEAITKPTTVCVKCGHLKPFEDTCQHDWQIQDLGPWTNFKCGLCGEEKDY